MALPPLLDAVRDFLETALTPAPKLIGDGYPVAAAELPAVTMSLSEVSQRLRGIGRVPVPTLRGALPVDTTLDLANPVVTFPDDTVQLLSGDRKTVQLAHGPLVRADGTATQPFAAGDLRVVLGPTTFTPVADVPKAGEVQVLPDTAQLLFAAPLPASGTLALGYFVGEWEVRTARYQGVLSLETFATDLAGVNTLSRQVATALDDPRIPGLQQVNPIGWTAVAGADPARAQARGRALTYRFDYELVEPNLATGGGLIVDVAVKTVLEPADAPSAEEKVFDVTREGS
jgi:hypothetical protein